MAMLVRGLLFRGKRYRCPVCNWSLRSFTVKHGLISASADGYCPRCNAKARHRHVWRYLQKKTNLFNENLRFLEVAPWGSFASRFSGMSNIEYIGMDLDPGYAFTTVAGDLSAAPLRDDTVDGALCIHVLEHVDDDRRAIKELFRVLKPGGWVVVSVPLLLNEETREDPSVTSAAQRKRLFGERGHVRYYGLDIIDRLEAAGFDVRFSPGDAVAADVRTRYGLRDGENIFHCTKPRIPHRQAQQ